MKGTATQNTSAGVPGERQPATGGGAETVVVHKEAHIRPEDAGRIAGAQSVDDKVNTLLRQLEAEANLSDGVSWKWYATMALSFMIGAFFSGFSMPSNVGGGASDPVTVGMVAPAFEVALYVI